MIGLAPSRSGLTWLVHFSYEKKLIYMKRGFGTMKKLIFTTVALLVVSAAHCFAQGGDNDIRLFMPDGQLKNLPVRVFITHDVTWNMNPKLGLSRRIPSDDKNAMQNRTIRPIEVAPNQRWVQNIKGQEVSLSGTLLLFDLRKYPIAFYKPMTRVVPALRWEEKLGKGLELQTAVSHKEVYLGNIAGAIGWTAFLVGILLILIARWSFKLRGKAQSLFVNPKGKLSLSRVQVCLWTIAIGSLVAMFGFIRLQIPDLPESLLVLMGLSLATSGISYKKAIEGGTEATKYEVYSGHLSDLISEINPKTGEPVLSVARAQMFFWTCIMLVLFVSKSFIDGVLWEVPWEMVTLMGMSQIGYVSSKFV